MKSILILGSTGMLGFGVASSMIKYKNLKISATIRSQKKLKTLKSKFPYNKVKKFHFFDANRATKSSLVKLFLEYDYIINCIGIIKPEINTSSTQSIKNAIYINSIFPKLLSESINDKKKIFQIATDCVFSGKKGRYNEKSKHDDLDIYGITKSLGEINNKNFYNLRTSIVGREFLTKKSLIEWFLKQNNLSVNGFNNHKWNGITTQAYGELLYTIIVYDFKIPNIIHIVPKNSLNKYELLKCFKKKFKIKVKINEFNSQKSVDRTLVTNYQSLLNKLWKLTIFRTNPTIQKMINLIQ